MGGSAHEIFEAAVDEARRALQEELRRAFLRATAGRGIPASVRAAVIKDVCGPQEVHSVHVHDARLRRREGM